MKHLPHDYTENLLPDDDNRGHLMLGRLIIALILVIAVMVGWAISASFAEAGGRDWSKSSAEAVAVAESNVSVNTGAAAYGGGASASITEERQAPALGGLALGGGHPCSYSPATAQISIIGGGAGFGGGKIDSACMLTVLGAASGDDRAYTAAGYMVAARDPAACRAMLAAGMVSGCGDEKVSTLPEGVNTGTGAKCVREGRKITFRATSAAAQAAELVACKASFGL